MNYLGDFNTSSTVRGFFNTRKSDGTPITLAGTPTLAVYKDGSTTESTSGVTLTVDFDSRTGMHLFAIDTSADGSFYSSSAEFRVVLTAGTVDGISVVGVQVGAFSLANRFVPSGSGDWSTNERTAIRSILGFDAGGTVSLPTVGVMDGIKDKTDLITSGNISVLPDRVNDNTITMQFNEVTTATVNLDENTTSATLQFVVARPDGTDVLTIANASITRNATSFTVTITTAVTATIGQYLWSLRDLTGGGNRVVTKGVLTVQNAASIDA